MARRLRFRAVNGERPAAASALRNPPIQQRSHARLARICTAAGTAFDELGVEGTSVAEIARRAGVSIGSLYRFFPSKSDLVHTMVEQYRQEHESSAIELFGEESLRRPAEEIVHEFVVSFLDVVATQPGWKGLTQAGYLFGGGTTADGWQQRVDRFLRHQVPAMPAGRRGHVAATFQALTGWLLLHAASSETTLRANLRETEAVLLGYVLELRRQTAS